MLPECIQDLKNDLNQIESYFEASKQGREFNFVIDIQPFTERIDAHLNTLKNYHDVIIALPGMNDKKLQLLVLHMRELSVECFFDKTSKKMFIDKFKAVQHDLNLMGRKA